MNHLLFVLGIGLASISTKRYDDLPHKTDSSIKDNHKKDVSTPEKRGQSAGLSAILNKSVYELNYERTQRQRNKDNIDSKHEANVVGHSNESNDRFQDQIQSKRDNKMNYTKRKNRRRKTENVPIKNSGLSSIPKKQSSRQSNSHKKKREYIATFCQEVILL